MFNQQHKISLTMKKPPNARHHAPPRAPLMKAALWAVACMRLLDRLKAPGRNAHSIGLAHSADLTPGITRRPASLKEFNKQRVGGRVHAVVGRRAVGRFRAHH
jgi:hypothetical protein